ncbi:translocase of chloroplast 90, chloroplastic isoform X2 [Mercurialis annua]|uniref:translocase of chloroplast 90, chloroplastic isoform X2 n=1 Tax=Mercurialis annua TaxID=3986 RepID=UPI00215E97E5|nr:translocase of chloroplast 90, chloroplastic isoform X2 [Mercurialis annua]
MKSVREWVFSQLVSKSVALSRPLSGSASFLSHDPLNEDSNHAQEPVCPDTSLSSNNTQEDGHHNALQMDFEDSNRSTHDSCCEQMDPLKKVEDLEIKFFRLLTRLGQSYDNLLVGKVLYRLHLAASIRAGETDLKRVRKVAAEQEATDLPKLNFSVRILVLGRTGVGKSATINSIFDHTKTMTDAFQPATNGIKEIVGTIKGVKVTFIDTPGFLPSSTSNMRKNKKIMLAVKKFIRRSPPDIVLFFERLDLVSMDYSDFPLLKLMTEVFGAAIWFNTILVMTHASSLLPEGPNGYPLNYESYVARCTDILQHYIHQAVSDSKLENLVLLVENHSQCKKNFMGESILPNGQPWKSQLLLLCVCNKILSDASTLLKFKDSIELGSSNSLRAPSLPHLLSSLLRHQSVSNPNEVDNDADRILLSDAEREDEYDELPPIRILTKSQFERLTKSQKRDYLDELDYRETLYLKKQLKDDALRRRKKKISEVEIFGEDDTSDDQLASPEAVPLPDMAVPPTFDSDCPVHRYRCLATGDQWLARPVLDPQGWDHDVGFDGINLETAVEMKKNIYASITGQMSKDKHNFSIQSECGAAYKDSRGLTYSVGFDVQSSGKDLIYTVHSDTRLMILKHNIANCAASLTSFGNKYYVGAKLEDSVYIGKRLKFVMNAGQMRGPDQAAYGGTLEATLRGQDYPARNDRISLSMTALSFKKEMVMGGGFQSEFRPMRGMTMAVNANLNSQKMGQISIKINSSEHIEITLIALFSVIRGLLRRKESENGNKEAAQT